MQGETLTSDCSVLKSYQKKTHEHKQRISREKVRAGVLPYELHIPGFFIN